MKHHLFTFGIFLLTLGLVLGFVWTTPASADNLYASIRGTVTDPSGAVVPGAKLTARNVDTGISFSSATNQDGSFNFLQLPIGNYTVKAAITGFKTYQSTGIHLDLNDVRVLNVELEVGMVSQEVTVEANPIQVEATDMQLGFTVAGKQIEDMPLNGRNWTDLQQLEPGVVASSDRFGTYSTNGAETQQNSFLINGTDTNDTELNYPLIIPSPDAIDEFRMVTSTINPEYGRNSGAILNAVIKNGTNQVHGDAFDFYRDTFLDAKSWFELKATPFHQNQFGGTLGGPIVRDHAFFFFSYQGTRATFPQPFTAPTVLSAAERGGDFSADTSGGAFPSGNLSPFPMLDSNGVMRPAGTHYSTLFPTGVIPTADLNPLALKLMNQYVPLPNAANDTYEFNPITAVKDDQYIYRVDEKATGKDAVWVYGLWERIPSNSTLPYSGSTLPGFAASNPTHFQEYTVAWNHTFSPTALNEARFAYLRLNFVSNEPQTTINPTSYGFTGITPQDPALASIPVINLSGLFQIGFSNDGPQPRIQNTYQVTDNFSKVWGHHTFKAGFNMDRMEINNPFYLSPSGSYFYGGSGLFSTGVEQADFLLGIPDSYSQSSGSIVRARGREYYSYFQDQWQARQNLTLTLGVGWDIETPYKNLYANGEIMAAFIPGEQSKIFPSAPIGIVYPGDPGVNQYGGPTVHYGDFAPRLGLAWSPDSAHKWSIRAGVGLYYNRTEEELVLDTLTNPPFSIESIGAAALGSSPGFANPYNSVNPSVIGTIPAGSIANPFPFTPPVPGAKINFVPFEPLGTGLVVEDPHMTAPRSTNYNLTIERQLSKSTILSVGYVGNVGRHLEGAYMLNQPGMAPGVNPVAVAAGCANDFALPTCAPQTFPYNPLVYGQPGVEATAFNSNYNSLQVSFNRHFSNGLQVGAAYTWSRYFDYTSNLENSAYNGPGINPENVPSMYGPSANDAPQRFVVGYMYTLPFYKLGHHWKRLTDDWNLAGATTFQHGFPVAVWNENFTSLISGGGFYNDGYYAAPDREDRTSTPLAIGNPRNYTINGASNYWINPAAFANPPVGQVGDANRNPFYGPGLNNWDMAVEKNVHITESKYFQLRMETFNTFNHAQFAAPVNVFGAPTFGQIFGVIQGTTNGDGRVVQLAGKFYF